MNHELRIILLTLLLVGAGCQSLPTSESNNTLDKVNSKPSETAKIDEPLVVLPLEGYMPTYRRFGEYFQGRFVGYHVAEDSEADSGKVEVPVRTIADGVVRYADWVSGYGGVIVIAHNVRNKKVNAIYGHVDIGSSELKVGDQVKKAQFIANLGDNKSRETDGERKHLHFALYIGDDLRLQGYEKNSKAVDNWINPNDFFASYGISFVSQTSPTIAYSDLQDPEGKKIFNLDFRMPSDWDVEYIPSLQSLNLYKVSGNGIARDRSQILIRYFDASDFLTLSTVTIFKTTDLKVGAGDYVARRYDIEKKSGVADFRDQPNWRNERHIVTDFRKSSGRTRYYVVAANPDLDTVVYERILESMEIL
jgi:hypothetical protein